MANKKINSLTSLRFIAAAMIVVHHSRGVLWLPKDLFQHYALDQGVSFFFVLSGFILTYVYPSLNGRSAMERFWIARIARIWPAHVVAFLMFIVVFLPGSLHKFLNLRHSLLGIFNLSLVQAWIPLEVSFFSFNAVAWSISVELLFYISFPLLIKRFATTWPYKLIGSALLVASLIYISHMLQLPSLVSPSTGITIEGLIYINPLSRLFEFILGMCAALLYQKVHINIKLGKTSGTFIEIVIFCAAFLSIYYSPVVASGLIKLVGAGGSAYIYHSGSSVFFAMLIFIMALEKGVISKVLQMKLPIVLGEISYSIYLFHQIPLRFYLVHVQDFSFISQPLLYLIYWVLLLICSYLVWLLIEKPCRHSIVKWANNRVSGNVISSVQI